MCYIELAFNFTNYNSLFYSFLNPLTCIDKCLNPRCNLVILAVGWIPSVLPWEDGTLQVWHHGQVATVG